MFPLEFDSTKVTASVDVPKPLAVTVPLIMRYARDQVEVVTPPFVFETVIEEGLLLFWETEDWYGVKFFVVTESEGPRNKDTATAETIAPTTITTMKTTSIVWLRPRFFAPSACPGTALSKVNAN